MKLLAIVGSPRKGGNTDLLMDQVVRGAQEADTEVERIFLQDLSIAPCNACDACLKTGVCTLEDDMIPLYDALYESDVWVLGTPIYFRGPSAQLKAFIDRWYAFAHAPWDQKVRGKRVILVAPFGDDDPCSADAVIAMLSKALDYLKMDFSRQVVAMAHARGAVAQNEEALKEAYEAGRNAFS